jgi:hypothetical protein
MLDGRRISPLQTAAARAKIVSTLIKRTDCLPVACERTTTAVVAPGNSNKVIKQARTVRVNRIRIEFRILTYL